MTRAMELLLNKKKEKETLHQFRIIIIIISHTSVFVVLFYILGSCCRRGYLTKAN